jgi:hypoxanthine phosphoribosyltransferase
VIAPPPTGRILLARDRIEARVRELGGELSAHYQGARPLVLGVMNGALFFLADLLRAVEFDLEIACLRLTSYAGTQSRGTVRGLEALDSTPAGRPVLIVDDILERASRLRISRGAWSRSALPR